MLSFIGIRQILMGDLAADTHTYTQTHTEGKINSLANPFGAFIIISSIVIYISMTPKTQRQCIALVNGRYMSK